MGRLKINFQLACGCLIVSAILAFVGGITGFIVISNCGEGLYKDEIIFSKCMFSGNIDLTESILAERAKSYIQSDLALIALLKFTFKLQLFICLLICLGYILIMSTLRVRWPEK